MKPMHIKVFTAFSGYDSQCLALDRLSRDYPDFSYELVECRLRQTCYRYHLHLDAKRSGSNTRYCYLLHTGDVSDGCDCYIQLQQLPYTKSERR